jgi:hypothetical protein
MDTSRHVKASGIAVALAATLWLVLRAIYWNGYYTEDAPGYVTDAIWAALGRYAARDHVNGLNVGTYLPVALPLRLFGKSEVALSLWPLASSLLGLLSLAGLCSLLFGRGFAVLAALLYATFPGDVFFSTVVMPDAIQAGWLSFAVFLAARAAVRPERSKRLTLIGAGIAVGLCHLVRANDVVLLPVVVAAGAILSIGNARHHRMRSAVTVLAGWALVVAAEAASYWWAVGNPLHRFTVVNAHYGTSASIARAGLNINPLTLPFSIFAPLTWWRDGGWGVLNQDQAYHGLLFVWALAGLLVAAIVCAVVRSVVPQETRSGLILAAVWFSWPLLYHQFGSQSLTSLVPMHRLSRHFVVYGPGAIVAVVAACAVLWSASQAAGLRRLLATAGTVLLAVHLLLNHQGIGIAHDAFHELKRSYARIRAHLPADTRTLIADPGDLCFFDFWMNPLGSEPVRMIPFAAYAHCGDIREGVVLTQSNPGWQGNAPVIQETVARLPCLVDPPSSWSLLYTNHPERVFAVEPRDGR